MRVTERTRIQSPRARIQDLRTRQSKTQEQVSTGRRVNRPSDDPLAALRINTLDTKERQVDQFDRNLRRGDAFLNQADGVLGESLDTLNRIRELTIQSISAVLTQQDANDIAAEVTSLREHLITLANTRVGDHHIFAGFLYTQPAYTTAGAFQGDANQQTLEIGDRQWVPITIPGGSAFGDGTPATQDVFLTLQNLITQIPIRNVAGFANIEAELQNLELATAQVIQARSQVGVRMSQFNAAKTVNAFLQERVPAQRSDLQDTSMTDAISELQLVDTALQTTLAATGRTINGPTLLDFLR
jgi:flagellar hook-associated protein 3 FlgL